MEAATLTREALAAWLRLAATPGLPPRAHAALLAAGRPLEALLGGTHAALAERVGAAAARALLAPPSAAQLRLAEATRAWLEDAGHALVTRQDPAYPPSLAQLYDPPPLLYVVGRLDLLHARGVAIVGSRHATPQGAADAAYFAGALSHSGLTVVSGLARGIDGAAHRGALAGTGSTVAVLGTGADLVYPACHRSLAHEIAAHGALVSEWPLGTPARAAHFPQRNRLIAGFASGVLVVEAALRSGSLITARLANEMGRDVFALPGSIHAPLARGCHALLREGAKLVETVGDVLEEYGLSTPECFEVSVHLRERRQKTEATAQPAVRTSRPAPRREPAEPTPHAPKRTAPKLDHFSDEPAAHAHTAAPLSAAAQQLLGALSHTPVPLDLLGSRSGLDPAALHHAMLELELAGRLAALPGGRFARLGAHRTGVGTAAERRVLHSKPSPE